jgi:hypothetical protein
MADEPGLWCDQVVMECAAHVGPDAAAALDLALKRMAWPSLAHGPFEIDAALDGLARGMTPGDERVAQVRTAYQREEVAILLDSIASASDGKRGVAQWTRVLRGDCQVRGLRNLLLVAGLDRARSTRLTAELAAGTLGY